MSALERSSTTPSVWVSAHRVSMISRSQEILHVRVTEFEVASMRQILLRENHPLVQRWLSWWEPKVYRPQKAPSTLPKCVST
jgi:hypothetical protein